MCQSGWTGAQCQTAVPPPPPPPPPAASNPTPCTPDANGNDVRCGPNGNCQSVSGQFQCVCHLNCLGGVCYSWADGATGACTEWGGILARGGATAYGKTLSEWAALWDQWVFTLPADAHPLFSATGDFASAGQSGPVFFIGPNLSDVTTQTPITRHISVPAGKSLLFPPVAGLYAEDTRVLSGDDAPFFPGEPDTIAAALQANLERFQDVYTVFLSVDGIAFTDSFVRHLYGDAVTLNFPIPAGGLADGLGGLAWAPDTTNIDLAESGYYVLLSPLEPGVHTIRFGGAADAPPAGLGPEDYLTDVTYVITVA